MTDKVEAFLIFCEDFRVDDGGKPMMIGVLAPTFTMIPHPGVSDQVFSVTFVNVPYQMRRAKLELSVVTQHPRAEAYTSRFGKLLERPKEAEPGQPWAAFLPLPVPIDEWRDRTLISAALKVEGVSAHASLLCRVEAQTKPKPKPKRRKVPSSKADN